MKKDTIRTLTLIGAAGLSALLAVGIAKAAGLAGCTVTTLTYADEALTAYCGTNPTQVYRAISPASTLPAGCTRASTDSVKIWLSMLQAAYLSGKQVDIVYTPLSAQCAANLITSVKLR